MTPLSPCPGLLVENEAVERADEECEADAEQRELRRVRSLLRRKERDQDYVRHFAERVPNEVARIAHAWAES